MKEKKHTFTYATTLKIKNRAAKKAAKENMTLSEKIHTLLSEYVKPIPKIKGAVDLPKDFMNVKSVGILQLDGTVKPLKP